MQLEKFFVSKLYFYYKDIPMFGEIIGIFYKLIDFTFVQVGWHT